MIAENLSAGTAGQNMKGSISLLFMVIMEQWPFLSDAHSEAEVANAAEWLARYFEYSAYIGENATLLRSIKSWISQVPNFKSHEFILGGTVDGSLPETLPNGLRELLKKDDINNSNEDESMTTNNGPAPVAKSEVVLLHLSPTEESEDHPGLNRWANMAILDAVEEGAVGDLLVCLCSKYEEIRKQALVNIHILASKLEVGRNFLLTQSFINNP